MKNQPSLICPVCREELVRNNKSLVCSNNHSFDIARKGYVNLLPVQQKHSLSPGDTKEMLLSRREFLDGGSYSPVCDSVIKALSEYLPENPGVLVDVGCGEGYYTEKIHNSLDIDCVGIDISKDGIKMACSRSRDILWLVATASHLPIKNESVGAVVAMFSILMQEEYARVLKKGGIVAEVTVGSSHLTELKSIIYDEVYPQHKHPEEPKKMFEELSCRELNFKTELDNKSLRALLMMTPHFWRIKEERRKMLESTPRLTVTADYYVRVLRKL